MYDKYLNGLLKRLPSKQFFYLFSKSDILFNISDM